MQFVNSFLWFRSIADRRLFFVFLVACYILPSMWFAVFAKDPVEIRPVFKPANYKWVQFLPDPRLCLTGGSVWNLETKKRAYSIEQVLASGSYVFSDDRKFMAASSGFTTLWDLEKKVPTKVNNYKTNFVAFSPDSRWLATFDMVDEYDHPRSLVIWNIKKRMIQATLKMGSDPDSPLVFSKDGNHLYYVTRDELREVSVDAASVQRTAKKDRLYSELWFMDSDAVIYGNGSGIIDSLDLSKQKFGATKEVMRPKQGLVRNGRHFASLEKSRVKLYDVDGKTIWDFVAHDRDCRAVAISPDSKFLLTGGDDWRVKLWSVEEKALKAWFVPTRKPVSDVRFSSDGTYFSLYSAFETTVWETSDLISLRNGASAE